MASPKSPMAQVPSWRTKTFWLLRSRCTTLGLYSPGDAGGSRAVGSHTRGHLGAGGGSHRRATAPGAGMRGRGPGTEPGVRCRPTGRRAGAGSAAGSPGGGGDMGGRRAPRGVRGVGDNAGTGVEVERCWRAAVVALHPQPCLAHPQGTAALHAQHRHPTPPSVLPCPPVHPHPHPSPPLFHPPSPLPALTAG